MLLSVSSVHLLGGLYGDVPSDVINVYQPPETDICITFKSSLMRGRFRRELGFGQGQLVIWYGNALGVVDAVMDGRQ